MFGKIKVRDVIIQVIRNSIMSMKNNISNGVKQGGYLSLNLFSVYLNKLINILRKCNICCRSLYVCLLLC